MAESGPGSKPVVPVWRQVHQSLEATALPHIAEQLDNLPKKNFTVLRVSQLDANELDTQLALLLTTQLKQIWVCLALQSSFSWMLPLPP